MFEKFLNWLWEDKRSAPFSAKPRLEALEAWQAPAVIGWLGYTSSYIDPANWDLLRLPQAGDILDFSGPNSGSSNPPVPPSGSNTSTTFAQGLVYPPTPNAPVTLPDNYYGIRIRDNYAGTLTIPFDIRFGEYTQSTGNTSTRART